MVANHRQLYGCYLALLSALTWPTFLVGPRTLPDESQRTAQAIVSACDHAVAVSAVTSERKPVVKGERVGLDGTARPLAERALVAGVRFPLVPDEDTSQPACGSHPSCALLCRFLV